MVSTHNRSLSLSDQDDVDTLTPLVPDLSQVGRGVLNASMVTATAIALAFVSCIAYFVFYNQYVPSAGVSLPIYLQYAQGEPTTASVALAFSQDGLATGQAYRISVELLVPTSDVNRALGNFMVGLSLVGSEEEPLVSAARPAILRYHSPLVRQVSDVAGLGLVLTGLRQEVERIHVPLLDGFAFESRWLTSPAYAHLRIDTTTATQLESLRCVLKFEAQFSGLVWVLVRFRLLSFLFFSGLFYGCALAVTLGTWIVLGLWTPSERLAGGQRRAYGKRDWDQGKSRPPADANASASDSASEEEGDVKTDLTEGFPRHLPSSVTESGGRSTHRAPSSSQSTAGFFAFDEDRGERRRSRGGRRGQPQGGRHSPAPSDETAATSMSGLGVHIKTEETRF